MDAGEFQAIDHRLREIEGRLSRLEHQAASTPQSLPAAPDENGKVGERFDLALAGQSILILGGAFLLRAATESATLPKHAGVAIGLAYASAWLVLTATRRVNAFYAPAAAIVAYPIVWEATTRFHVMSASVAAMIVAAFSIALIVVGRTLSMEWLAWIAAGGATLDTLLLAWATKDLTPFLLELTAIGVAAMLLSMNWVAWMLAIESGLFALLLIATTLLDDKPPRIMAVLIVFAVAWLVKPGVQAIAGALIGFGGATAIVMLRGVPATSVAIAELIIAAVLYALAFRRDETYDSIAGGIAALGGAILLLSPAGRAIAFGLAAIGAAEIARRRASAPFAAQSAIWGVLAPIGGAASMGIAAALCFVAFLRKRNIVLLAVAAGGATALIAMHDGVPALLRSAILAGIALALAVAGRQWRIREASQLAIVALIIAGLQVVIEVLRAGNAATMFIALAMYGGAMLGIARLRKTATATS
jgi:hypothetical protein